MDTGEIGIITANLSAFKLKSSENLRFTSKTCRTSLPTVLNLNIPT